MGVIYLNTDKWLVFKCIKQIIFEVVEDCDQLTLFPTAYPVLLCYGGDVKFPPPPQLKTYLGVIDSNFFIHSNKTMSN